MAVEWIELSGIVRAGYGVASGQGKDSPYPAGSIALQTPFFRDRQLDLSPYFPGTLNIDIAPYQFQLIQPSHTLRQVAWFPTIPPEDFSFSPCRIAMAASGAESDAENACHGLVYYPHPETKPDHFQDPTLVEVLAPFIEGMTYGTAVRLFLRRDEVEITSRSNSDSSVS